MIFAQVARELIILNIVGRQIRQIFFLPETGHKDA